MLALAIIPAVVLMVYIFIKDKREKEPFKLLLKCFFFGAISLFPAVFAELLVEKIYIPFLTEGSVSFAFIDAFIGVALLEELFKYLFLRWGTWKSPSFNCSFDGIVYAVFVSLGFAMFENITYVMDGSLFDAIMRMFTAVPGHACDAVYMGYFYSKAKQASILGDKKKENGNIALALIVPFILHGVYDFLISVEEEVIGAELFDVFFYSWVVFVLAMFIVTFRMVNKASKNDMYFIVPFEPQSPVAWDDLGAPVAGVASADPQSSAAWDDLDDPNDTVPKQDMAETGSREDMAVSGPQEDRVVSGPKLKKQNWICSCGLINDMNFCPECGAKKPENITYNIHY